MRNSSKSLYVLSWVVILLSAMSYVAHGLIFVEAGHVILPVLVVFPALLSGVGGALQTGISWAPILLILAACFIGRIRISVACAMIANAVALYDVSRFLTIDRQSVLHPEVTLIPFAFLTLALQVLGVWLVIADKVHPLGTCEHCGYDRAGSINATCPECGHSTS